MSEIATPVTKPPITRLQRTWMIVYWLAVPITALLLLQALISLDVAGFVPMTALLLATVALLLGLMFSHRLLKARPDDVVFLKGTTTIRAIAVAWLLIQLAIISGTIIAVAANLDDVTVVDWSGGFASTVGSLSILAMIGPGYAEYREAQKVALAESEHAS